MSEIVLSAGRLRATILPHLGAGIADFSLQGPSGFYYPIMRRAAHGEMNASLLSSFIMAPWVNRIGGAKFAWAGKEYKIRPTTSDGMAQHGDVRKRPWHVVTDTAAAATIDFNSETFRDSNWPWRYRCRVEYVLTPEAFSIDFSLTNSHNEPFPAGCGHHPYFMRRLWNDRDVLELRAPVTARYPLAAGCATGAPVAQELTRHLSSLVPIPDQHIDAVCAGFSGRADFRWQASGVTMRMVTTPNLGHLVIFAPHAQKERSSPLAYVAVEPQSHTNDALNLAARGIQGTGVVILKPGETMRTTCRFEVGVDGC